MFFITLPFMLESNWYRQYYLLGNCFVLSNQTRIISPSTVAIKYYMRFQNTDAQPTYSWSVETTSPGLQFQNGQFTSCYFYYPEATLPVLLEKPDSNYVICLVMILIINKYTFGESSTEIAQYIQANVDMVFKNDRTVDFLNYNWKGNELEDDYKKILYLFSFINKRYFRITLIVKKNTNFMDGFLSGDIRVHEDGDFSVKAVLRPVSCKTRQSQIKFEDIDKYFVFIPHEHQKILKEPKTVGIDKKNDWLDEEVLSWSVGQNFELDYQFKAKTIYEDITSNKLNKHYNSLPIYQLYSSYASY
eukprot:gene593-8098_t